nr:immunoglobulin light chain junction region [Macaca mulatta]MOV73767.1 immunoglobulin light chain junction region [Macaca mulatta]
DYYCYSADSSSNHSFF